MAGMFGASSSGKYGVNQRRWIPAALLPYRILLVILWIVAFSSAAIWHGRFTDVVRVSRKRPPRPVPLLRPRAFNLTQFGAVGDGVTLNTAAFEKAVAAISRLSSEGGGQLNVPSGVWLTGPFNLTSHMTLFLEEGAVILGSDDEKLWTLMPPLPSYGQGRDHKGPRYGSLIHGQHLRDIVLTGHNGTIDGHGQKWWRKFREKKLSHTRGPLLQLLWSRDIVISNITLQNSPFWTVHPYDCRNVSIVGVTILAPVFNAPNTDGIDPDSCQDVVIEDCYICVGDDGIAIKSGWDQYGIAYQRPSSNILIRNVILRSTVSAGISIGSEMSGGVSNVTVEKAVVWDSRRGVRIKTAPGRGGYVRDITYRGVELVNLRVGIVVKTDYNEHPDGGFDPGAVPAVERIAFEGVRGRGVRVAVRIQGSAEIPVRGVRFRDVAVGLTYKKKHVFQCAFVEGRVVGAVFPAPCANLDLYDERGHLVRPSPTPNTTDVDYDV
ncbi:putative polygalacturonase [Wolffia australiana]